MRIGTWNLDHARRGAAWAPRLARVRNTAADIWVLTETRDEVAPEGFVAAHSDQRPQAEPGERWVSIWSKYDIEKVATDDPCRTVAALVDTPFGPLLMYGTVMPWHSDRGADGTAKFWSEHRRVIPLQLAEWARLRRAHPEAEFCAAGDFNMHLDLDFDYASSASTRPYGLKQTRQHLLSSLVDGDLVCPTARCPVGLSLPMIDHIVLSEALGFSARVVEVWDGTEHGSRMSDHSGVVVLIPGQ